MVRSWRRWPRRFSPRSNPTAAGDSSPPWRATPTRPGSPCMCWRRQTASRQPIPDTRTASAICWRRRARTARGTWRAAHRSSRRIQQRVPVRRRPVDQRLGNELGHHGAGAGSPAGCHARRAVDLVPARALVRRPSSRLTSNRQIVRSSTGQMGGISAAAIPCSPHVE